MKRLNEEQVQDILELMQLPGYRPLLAELKRQLEGIQYEVLTYALGNGAEGLVHTKARAEGAEKLYVNFLDSLSKLEERLKDPEN